MNDTNEQFSITFAKDREAAQADIQKNRITIPAITNNVIRFPKEKSNLPDDVWFHEAGAYRLLGSTSPIIKVGDDYKRAIPVTISQNPMAMAEDSKASRQLSTDEWHEIYKFISLNYKLIMRHWEGKIGFHAMRRELVL